MNPVTTVGKRWRLRRLADVQRCFSMVAIKQLPPFFAELARTLGCAPQQVSFAEVLAAKRVLGEGFAAEPARCWSIRSGTIRRWPTC